MSEQQRLIKKLDKKLSQFIREKGNCYTCGKVAAHAGHFIRRGIMATRFDPNNIRPQCVRCNTFLYGNAPEYALRLRKEIGDKSFEGIIKVSRKTKQWSNQEIEKLLACETLAEYEKEYAKIKI